MLLSFLLLLPFIGGFVIFIIPYENNYLYKKRIKIAALITSITIMIITLLIYIGYDSSFNHFQYVEDFNEIKLYDIYLGLDGASIYFVLLTSIIVPISLLSNYSSITKDIKLYIIIILLLELLLLTVFIVLDGLSYYIFFESILGPLFVLIGIFGSKGRVRACFYLFLYTLLGSLFLLLSILSMSSTTGYTDYDAIFKSNYDWLYQLFLFYGVFIAFAVKTPTIFLNTWLLKAHVESPLAGSIVLAAIVLKLSLYGVLRFILTLLAKAALHLTSIVYTIGVISIFYASYSTIRTIDVKELIAYSSVSHAAVYLMAVFSNTIQGIEGGILLGLAHGLTSSGLFICVGGILYDRTNTRVIYFYRGLAQIMPLFALLFFILSLGNSGVPLTLNFLGEFLSLYGIFERLPTLGVFASSSIIFSAAYTIFMYNRISFAGSYSKYLELYIPDLFKREYTILFTLVLFIIMFGLYPSCILDGLHYDISKLLYGVDSTHYCTHLDYLKFNSENVAIYIIDNYEDSTCIDKNSPKNIDSEQDIVNNQHDEKLNEKKLEILIELINGVFSFFLFLFYALLRILIKDKFEQKKESSNRSDKNEQPLDDHISEAELGDIEDFENSHGGNSDDDDNDDENESNNELPDIENFLDSGNDEIDERTRYDIEYAKQLQHDLDRGLNRDEIGISIQEKIDLNKKKEIQEKADAELAKNLSVMEEKGYKDNKSLPKRLLQDEESQSISKPKSSNKKRKTVTFSSNAESSQGVAASSAITNVSNEQTLPTQPFLNQEILQPSSSQPSFFQPPYSQPPFFQPQQSQELPGLSSQPSSSQPQQSQELQELSSQPQNIQSSSSEEMGDPWQGPSGPSDTNTEDDSTFSEDSSSSPNSPDSPGGEY